ncbi:MAG: PaaI family thioesterase [Chloroflexota bacterium]
MEDVADLRARAEREPVALFLGMSLVDLAQGYARVRMQLRPEHLNFNGMVFGGIIVALADQAFAYASNSAVRPSIASQFNVHFLRGPKVGDELVAECRVLKSGARVGVSEVEVVDQEGQLVAKATGTTIPTGGARS